MSKASILLTTLMPAILASGKLQSQTSAPTTAQLLEQTRITRHLYDSLVRVSDSIGRRGLDSLSAELTDTLQVGPFHILAARARVPLARAAAEMALESSPQSIRDTAAVALRNVVVMVRKAHFLANAGKEVVGQSLSALTTKEDLAQAFRQVLARQLNAGLDEAVRNWMGGAMPIGAATHEALAPFYIDLATRPSRPARACLRGDANGCAMAIRLVTPKDTVFEWMDAVDRREAVRKGVSINSSFINRADARSCIDDERDDACERILRKAGSRAIPFPLAEDASQTLLLTALELGGKGSLARFVADTTAPIGDRLARAANRDINGVLLEWRRRTVASRPASPMPTESVVWSAVAMVMVMGASSAGKFGRWA